MKRALSAFAYRFLTLLTRVVVFTFGRWEVEGADRLPREGGVLLAANHLHLLDPPLIGSSAHRRLHPMAKRELFETPLVGWVLWAYGAFPVRRFSGDMGALRVARNYLRNGEAVLVFPEGTRARGRGLQPALPGSAMVALLARVPVVPVAVSGTDHIRIPWVFFQWLRRRRPHIRVVFGEPFMLEQTTATARQAEAATDSMMRRIAALLPPEYRGAYAGSTDAIVVARQARARVSPKE